MRDIPETEISAQHHHHHHPLGSICECDFLRHISSALRLITKAPCKAANAKLADDVFILHCVVSFDMRQTGIDVSNHKASTISILETLRRFSHHMHIVHI